MATNYDILRLLKASGWPLWFQAGDLRAMTHPAKPGVLIYLKGPLSEQVGNRALARILACAGLDGSQEMEYTVLVEKTGTGYNAYCPDIGCISSTGRTVELAVGGFKEAFDLFVKHSREFGRDLPEPSLIVTTVKVDPGAA